VSAAGRFWARRCILSSKMPDVSARRRDKINSDEEERVRLGYELQLACAFPSIPDALPSVPQLLQWMESLFSKLTYGQAAMLWRINLGWARRQEKNQFGFVLDTERGYWAKGHGHHGRPGGSGVGPHDTRHSLCGRHAQLPAHEPATRHDLRVMLPCRQRSRQPFKCLFNLKITNWRRAATQWQ